MPCGVIFMPTDRDYMARALELAEHGRGRTSPNPMVGCVVVRDGRIVGEGYHRRSGEPHAEVHAVEAVGTLEDATVYVTLEPCCHEGKTPPCTGLLVEKKAARLVAAMEDPNPLVSGRGLETLRASGCKVDVGLLEDSARRLNEAFIKYVETRTPFVIAKCAMTLDGKIATRTGDSRWVTGEAARRRVHELRDEVDAIMIGSHTVATDDPRLTTRLEGADTRDPIRIILSMGNRLDPNRAVFHSDSDAPTWLAAPEGTRCDEADDVIEVPSDESGLDLKALMKELGRREITTVLLEGGGIAHASALRAGIVDKVLFFVAPKIVGGRDSITPVEGEGIEKMDAAIQLENMTATPVGEDILIEAYIKKA